MSAGTQGTDGTAGTERTGRMTELIQWPRAKYWDKPWNPVIGCKPVSSGCANCYARALVTGRWNLTGICSPDFTPTFKPKSKIPKHGVIFCGNMTDLFGEWLDEHPFTGPNTFPDPVSTFISETLDDMRYCFARENRPTYLWLTKRVERMCKALHEGLVDVGRQWWKLDRLMRVPRGKGCMNNQFWGFTAENQEWFERRQKDSLGMPSWANLWYSLEPLLGPISMRGGIVRSTIKWVVVGCESGPKRRPCKVEWVENIVWQCMEAGVPVFVKQLDLGGRCVTDIEKFPEHLRIRQVPWAKKKGGEA